MSHSPVEFPFGMEIGYMTIAKSVIHPRFTGKVAGQSIDPRLYRTTLSQFPTSICIVTSLDGDTPVGMVIGSFSSISLDPALVGFFVDLKSVTSSAITRNGRFLVNLLGGEHADMCQRFFRDPSGRFRGEEWATSQSGLPKLEDAVAWIECTVDQSVKLGDHRLIVGRVENLAGNPEAGNAPALLFHRGNFTASTIASPAPEKE